MRFRTIPGAPRTCRLLLLAIVTIVGCRSAPMVHPPPIASPLGAESNRQAILRGLVAHRWMPLQEEPGRITAMQDKGSGKHTATVDILYDDDVIQIRYLGSHNLRCVPADDACSSIHRAYNRWVVQLRKDLEYGVQVVEMQNRAAQPVGAGVP